MKLRQLGGRARRRARAERDGAENFADVFAQRLRAGEQLGGEFGPRSGLGAQPIRVLGRERAGMLQPVRDVPGLAQMVAMRGVAAAGFRIGEIEGEGAADQRQSSRRGSPTPQAK